jgi:outer membrane biosynthesis protein TonB
VDYSPERWLKDRMKRSLALLLSVMGSAALAQTTGTVSPSAAPAQPSVKEDVPPGGCMPIGLTASGEIVFPIQCRELIERHRETTVEQKPAAVEEKRAASEEKPAVIEQKSIAAEDKPAAVEQKPVAEEQKPAAVEDKPAAAEQKPAAVEEKPAAVAEKPPAAEQKPPAVEEKPATQQSEAATPENNEPANKAVETASSPKRMDRESRKRVSANNCTHYRTYNRASGTYRDFDGRTRPCR